MVKNKAASVHETHHHENLDRNLDGAERKREVMRPRIVIVVVVHQSLSPSPTLLLSTQIAWEVWKVDRNLRS